MTLKNVFEIMKADRYTADGREEIKNILAEDKTYQIGEISQKTGLQKTANGWVKPKSGTKAGATGKPTAEGAKEMELRRKAMAGDPEATKTLQEMQKKWKAESEALASKPAEEKPKAPKPSVQEYIKAKSDIKKMEEAYKKQKDDYDYTQRVKSNGGDISLMFPMNVKPKDLSENADYLKAKDIISRMEAKDSAPRILTGDCKIRIRK